MNYPPIETLCFFGTFNPPHLGHAHALMTALQSIPSVRRVLCIPPVHHVWGKHPVSYQDRLAMAKLAFEPLDPRIHVSDIESSAELSGYTLDTLQALRSQTPTTQLGVVMGSDSLLTFDRWRQWQDILAIAPLFVAPRGSDTQAEINAKLPHPLAEFVGKFIFLLPDSSNQDALSASSTQVRLQIPGNGKVEICPAVMTYIQEHHLYGV